MLKIYCSRLKPIAPLRTIVLGKIRYQSQALPSRMPCMDAPFTSLATTMHYTVMAKRKPRRSGSTSVRDAEICQARSVIQKQKIQK